MKYFRGLMSLGVRVVYGIVVNLLTVKLLLNFLDEEYYGIYSLIIGGCLIAFSYLQAANVTAQRYFSFNREDSIKLRFQLYSLLKYLIKIGFLCLIISYLGVNFYFFTVLEKSVLFKLSFPILFVSFYTFFQVLGIPFNALLSSLEKFKLFSFAVGFDNTIRLLAAFSALFPDSNSEKLMLCCFVLFLGSVFSLLLKIKFIKKVGIDISLSQIFKSNTLKDLHSFTAFSSLGLISKNTNEHGNNFLVDNFFGTIFVSYRTVANQLFNLLIQFSGTLFLAFKSDIIFNFANDRYDKLNTLILTSSKILLLLGLVIIFPLFKNMDLIIFYWLGKSDLALLQFSKLSIIASLILSLHYPLTAIVHASGQIKNYSMVTEGLVGLSFVITFILFLFDFSVITVFYISIFSFSLAHLSRIYFCHFISGFKSDIYIRKFLYPTILLIIILFLFIPFFEETIFKIKNVYVKIIVDIFSSLVLFFIVFDKDFFKLYNTMSIKLLNRNNRNL